MTVYYNDSDPFVCAWLRNLITAKLLLAGDVDERPIEHVQASDVAGYEQCHFFVGIGGWPYALQLAGWGERPVWTGSCPCQPLSGAGRRKGHADRRHVWPAFYRLITERRPPVVFGEQVGKNLGREWFAGVRADLEGIGYACGAADLPAASVGAPHARQRLFFVAHSERDGGMAERRRAPVVGSGRNGRSGISGDGAPSLSVEVGALVGARVDVAQGWATEPPDIRVAHGLPGGALDGYGNAIVPQVAAAFVSAYMEIAFESAVAAPPRDQDMKP